MEDISSEKWYKEEVEKYVSEYGYVPPQWIVFPNSHPYSIQWRMGYGEGFLMMFYTWLGKEFSSEEEKIAFFLKNPPPPRWLQVMADCIWEEGIDFETPFEETVYYGKLKDLGFEGVDKFSEDMDNPKWE